jgi:hypothetical protein
MKDFSNYKFRCSSLGALMTNQPGKKDTKTLEELSETTKNELVKIYLLEVYGRDKEIKSKYINKGLEVEEDSITLLSRIKEMFLVKNSQRFENEFITGEPDVTSPLYDLKSCWDLHTFFEHKTKKLKSVYEWQMRGYAELIDAPYGTVAFCLIDTPLGIVESEKRRLMYDMNATTSESPYYLEACQALEKEMMFSDIPMEERIHEVDVKRHPEEMQKCYDRIVLCREWLNEFANKKVKVLV